MVFVNPVPAVHQNEGIAVPMQDNHGQNVSVMYFKKIVVHMVVVFGWVTVLVQTSDVEKHLVLFVAVIIAGHFILKS